MGIYLPLAQLVYPPEHVENAPGRPRKNDETTAA